MIKKSLKRRIDFSFMIIIAITLAVMAIFELVFLEDVYVRGKKDILVSSYELVNEEINSNNLAEHADYCQKNDLMYIITDSNLDIINSNSKEEDEMIRLLFGTILGMEENNTEILYQGSDYQIINIKDSKYNLNYLELWGYLDGGYYYAVRYPMSNITEAARTSFVFFMFLGIIMLALSAIVIRQITKRIMKPVSELSRLSGKMANLDFEARYTVGGEDEIGQLGANFNIMSKKLEETVSELKSANARLEKDLAEKEQIDEMRQEFLSNVSHELKTPIALVQGYAEGLKEIVQDPESRDYYCNVIIDEANKMNHLVKQLLELNQLESGRDQLEFSRFDISELIKGILNASKIMIEQKEAVIKNDVTEPVYVWGDEFRIEQVLTNYLSNALNHLENERIIHIAAEEKDGIVTVTVFNTGKTIPPEELDKIWTKFYKVDKARSRQYGGSGIGLSIVKAVMELHRQKCWAENYENGVAFKFTLSSR